MAMMEESHYLPEETLKAANYPEVQRVKVEMDKLDEFATVLNSAVSEFNDDEADKIYVSVGSLRENIERCRMVLQVLGEAERPCFDIIMDYRELLVEFQEVLYAYNQHGDKLVSTAEKPEASEVDEDEEE